jgi:type II secretory pathway pseudopilin PulG
MASSAHHGHWIPEEAAMAAITFNTAHQKQQVRKQIEAALAAYREMLDTFVSNQMRRTAAEAEHGRPRQTLGATSPAKDAQ